MSHLAVVGVNWGDEGKGRMVDLLTAEHDIVVRYQGGGNAGHTVINEYGKFALHLLPSGVFRKGVVNILGNGVALDPENLWKEIEELREKGIAVTPENLKISDRASLLLPWHRLQDGLEEARLADKKYGSTKQGIAPFYSDKYQKKTAMAGEMAFPEHFRTHLEELREWKNLTLTGVYGAEPFSREALEEWISLFCENIRPFVCDTGKYLDAAVRSGKRILFEAQLGALRDLDLGIYPYTTSSNTLAAYAPIGAGLPSVKIGEVIGVVKAYSTCVGEGPFVSEMFGEEAEKLRAAGAEYGAKTGRPRRVGPLDLVATRYGVGAQGATALAITKLDVLSYMDKIPVCTKYRINGTDSDRFPFPQELAEAAPVLEYVNGWKCDISGVRRFEDLPKEARDYVLMIEKAAGCPVKYISVGPERESIILRETAPDLRTERDSLGEIQVPADKYWGAQTERSRRNFPIGAGLEKMPEEMITALALLKRAAAAVNHLLLPEKMTQEKLSPLITVCDEIINGKLKENFPLVVWQTGSGTQTNMNLNEVIAARAGELLGSRKLHPNDDVNLSQSSNDIFSSAMHVAAVTLIEKQLVPALDGLIRTLQRLEEENKDVLKSARTHLMDAVPMRFSQELSGWRTALENDREMILSSLDPLRALAAGGTAAGTGLNAPEGFDREIAAEISRLTGSCFRAADNKFQALAFKSELVFAHGALKTLACDLMKIANDIRHLAGGPRCGLSEITIPANEPGSSIMPGKVNPTQCEAVAMVAVQVMGNDVTIGLSASQGHFQLNTYMPVMIYNFLQSVRLLSDVMRSFDERCVSGIRANREKMQEYLNRSLMPVTALSPVIGYEKAAEIAQKAIREDLSLREACLALGYMSADEFDAVCRPEEMA